MNGPSEIWTDARLCQARLVEIVTVVLSILAFAMSVISLWWQIARAQADRPTLHVEGVAACTVMDEDYSRAAWSFTITIANTGSEAITVDDASWAVQTTGGWLRVKSSATSPDFPIRLQGTDSRTWTYELPIRGTRWDGLIARPLADFVGRPSRSWRRRGQSVRRTQFGVPQQMVIPPEWKDRIESFKPQ